ncbi:hypothetical protein ACQ4PT_015925 [Festuca glaucescens]
MAAPALNCIFCIFLLSTSSSTSGHVAEASCRSRSRRELLGATTVRDVFAPVTNPVTVPATNPASNPGVVTVPSTNPGFATNPNFPPLYQEPSTMPDPSMTTPAPFTNPVTAPITNPATTPTAVPGTSPVTNPATYPYPPQGGGVGAVPTTPVYPAPATTVPIGATPVFPAPATTVPTGAAPTTMAGAGTWCVAKAGVMEAALQAGMDYACGKGGADCSALQPMGSCYNPNTMQAHASYAFNSYFQRNPSPASCDFGGAGMLVATNPSSGACMYQTSSGTGYTGTTGPVGMTPGFGSAGMTPGYSTGPTTGTGPAVGGGSGSTVLNANNNPGGTSMYGPDNPTGFSGASSGAASLSFDWVLSLIWIFTIAYVKEKV